MGLNHVIFEDELIEKLKGTIKASERITAAVVENKPTEGAVSCFAVLWNRASDAHTDALHNPELAKQKKKMLEELLSRLKHIRDFHEREYSKIAPFEAISPQIYERMNMNLEISRIRVMERYILDTMARINTVSYEQLRTGGSSEKALVSMKGMITARKETIILNATKKQYHANGVLAFCYDTNRQTAEQMFHAKVHQLLAQPHGQFEILPQYDERASLSSSNNDPPSYDPFAPSNVNTNSQQQKLSFT